MLVRGCNGACCRGNSYVPCRRPYRSLYPLRWGDRTVQISQLSRLRFNMERTADPERTRQGLQGYTPDRLALPWNYFFNPEIVVSSWVVGRKCQRRASIQEAISGRERRTR